MRAGTGRCDDWARGAGQAVGLPRDQGAKSARSIQQRTDGDAEAVRELRTGTLGKRHEGGGEHATVLAGVAIVSASLCAVRLAGATPAADQPASGTVPRPGRPGNADGVAQLLGLGQAERNAARSRAGRIQLCAKAQGKLLLGF
uniref:(northern house mosquito) hypothetical protein n=1 Tax=Culex pipiens TaxID=7175 RepID=A0A8D8FEC2_CULPI